MKLYEYKCERCGTSTWVTWFSPTRKTFPVCAEDSECGKDHMVRTDRTLEGEAVQNDYS